MLLVLRIIFDKIWPRTEVDENHRMYTRTPNRIGKMLSEYECTPIQAIPSLISGKFGMIWTMLCTFIKNKMATVCWRWYLRLIAGIPSLAAEACRKVEVTAAVVMQPFGIQTQVSCDWCPIHRNGCEKRLRDNGCLHPIASNDNGLIGKSLLPQGQCVTPGARKSVWTRSRPQGHPVLLQRLTIFDGAFMRKQLIRQTMPIWGVRYHIPLDLSLLDLGSEDISEWVYRPLCDFVEFCIWELTDNGRWVL